jgi:hypothetical protein
MTNQAILLLNETSKFKVENSTQTPIRLPLVIYHSPLTALLGWGAGHSRALEHQILKLLL